MHYGTVIKINPNNNNVVTVSDGIFELQAFTNGRPVQLFHAYIISKMGNTYYVGSEVRV